MTSAKRDYKYLTSAKHPIALSGVQEKVSDIQITAQFSSNAPIHDFPQECLCRFVFK